MKKQRRNSKARRHEGTKARRGEIVSDGLPSCLRAFVPSCLLAFASFTACTQQAPAPKPYGYFNISLPAHEYDAIVVFPEFAFPASSLLAVQPVSDSVSGRWFNLVYPELNAVIYCSYLPITANSFRQVAEDSYQFVYKHAIKADAIQPSVYDHVEENVHAILYELKGNVASPLQFVVTDSVRHWFRGSLYFNHEPNQDSIAPVVAYLKEDIVTMINGLYWR